MKITDCRLLNPLLLLVGFLVGSCQPNNTLDIENERPKISFILSLGEEHSTRATEGIEMGSADYDNKIDPADLRIILYDRTTEAYLGSVQEMSVTQISSNTYQFVGALILEEGVSNTLDCYVMVFANCGDVAAKSNQGNATTLGALPYSYSAAAYSPTAAANVKKLIPMWGFKSATFSAVAGTREELGTIYLIRSMAKVEVILDESVTGWTLTTVQHSRYYTSGLYLPRSFQTLNITEPLGYTTIEASAAVATDAINYNVTTAGRSYYIYLPEFNNLSSVQKSTIKLRMNNGSTTRDFTLYFKNYDEQQTTLAGEWDIIRNNYYKFRIVGVAEDINLYYTVEPWVIRNVTIPDFE
ncbi:MAG: hypothetical protein ACRC3Z_04505 [Phocaeicola sp.]